MKVIVIDVENTLLAEGIMENLKRRGDFKTERVINSESVFETCVALNADVLLLEVSRSKNCNFQKRLEIIKRVKEKKKNIKIALLVDENSDKDNAEKCINAKKEKLADEFFYTTVSGEYLAACLDSL